MEAELVSLRTQAQTLHRDLVSRKTECGRLREVVERMRKEKDEVCSLFVLNNYCCGLLLNGFFLADCNSYDSTRT